MNRREFLHTVGGVAVLGSVGPAALGAPDGQAGRAEPRRPRVAVLWEPGLRAADVEPVPEDLLRRALSECDATWLSASELAAGLARDRIDVVVLTSGSAFPKPAWAAIQAFLRSGGNLVNLGGVPFAVPAVPDGEGWRHEVRQTAFHRHLGITQAYPIDIPAGLPVEASAIHGWSRALLPFTHARRAWGLYVRLASTKRVADEDGSEGPHEGVVDALLSVHRQSRRPDATPSYPFAAPVVLVDRLAGDGLGGRWIFVTADRAPGADGLAAIVHAAAAGCQRLDVQTSRAVYEPGQPIACTVTSRRPGADPAAPFTATARITLTREASGPPIVRDVTLSGLGPIVEQTVVFPGAATHPTHPASFQLDVAARQRWGLSQVAFDSSAVADGWVARADSLDAGVPIDADGATLRRNGAPFIVAGTTFMPHDTQRRFLVDSHGGALRSMARVADFGANTIRTGIWTGWSEHADGRGVPTPAVLDALDAFLLTACRRHGLTVVFTFFAFLPYSWGGANPYLDPAAVAAQTVFITTIVRRYRGMKGIIWDLVNEPSFSSAAQLWTTRPNDDEFERRAWEAWLAERYPAPSAEARARRLQEMWRCAPGGERGLPALADFTDANLFGDRHPLKALDYRLFAQDMFRRWTDTMRAAIRDAGGSDTLVTVGQDEGGVVERPSNQFFGASVDVTSIHTWWFNDDQLWDLVTSKHPARPNLVQETGVMHYEQADGRAWRTEEGVRDLLERKLALAVGAGGAGFINWTWHTNPYLPSDNEAAIGLLRTDGTHKPEFEAWLDAVRFAGAAGPHLRQRLPDEVLMVIPHANQFSVRSQAVDATRRSVRAMHYECRVAMSAVGEFNLDSWPGRPALAVLPSPRVLSSQAWARLMAWVEQGTTLVVSGPFDDDEHWLPTGRMALIGLPPEVRAVMPEEAVTIDDARHRARFRGEKIQRVETSAGPGEPTVRTSRHGLGCVLWSPVPVEASDDIEPVAALYRSALREAGVAPRFTTDAPPSVLVYPAVYAQHALYTLVSDAGRDLRVHLTDRASGRTHVVDLPSGRAAMFLIDRKRGDIAARYPED